MFKKKKKTSPEPYKTFDEFVSAHPEEYKNFKNKVDEGLECLTQILDIEDGMERAGEKVILNGMEKAFIKAVKKILDKEGFAHFSLQDGIDKTNELLDSFYGQDLVEFMTVEKLCFALIFIAVWMECYEYTFEKDGPYYFICLEKKDD